ncbi:MAG: hypothetical protein ABS76_09470 [Pelagibacterium sp. SCN 64-44]|nr:MAG: hypothetical protein ABS76_09470 [Pelagibacterium sp. SCN 64-44]
MQKSVVIIQSNYIPWKGYFDLIASADEFIIYDDVQFTKNDWRNRNLIKAPGGLQWLTVPVGSDIHRRIRDVDLPQGNWQKKHWKALEASYGRAPFYSEISDLLRPAYFESQTHLSKLNRLLIEQICQYIGIHTHISNSWDHPYGGERSERLVQLCQSRGATHYISGPAARDYLDVALFEAQGITVQWFDYGGYRDYPQPWGEFTHQVSVVDLLFNCGKASADYMRYVK